MLTLLDSWLADASQNTSDVFFWVQQRGYQIVQFLFLCNLKINYVKKSLTNYISIQTRPSIEFCRLYRL